MTLLNIHCNIIIWYCTIYYTITCTCISVYNQSWQEIVNLEETQASAKHMYN